MNIRYCHVCISCRNWKLISKFYQDVFGCIVLDPPRYMSGPWAGQLIGADESDWESAEVVGEHIAIPNDDGDVSITLEILSYKPLGADNVPQIFDRGLSHICFEVPTQEEVAPLVEKLIAHGGSVVSRFDYRNERVAYCRDPEGNLVEIRRPNDSPDTIRQSKK